jgi:hypothetical protein
MNEKLTARAPERRIDTGWNWLKRLVGLNPERRVIKRRELPSVHHVWCNGQKGPVKDCRWCAPENRPGLWEAYPYDPVTGPENNFTEKHFPGLVKR